MLNQGENKVHVVLVTQRQNGSSKVCRALLSRKNNNTFLFGFILRVLFKWKLGIVIDEMKSR